MDKLDVDSYYGAYTRQVGNQHNAGDFRVFAVGYIDQGTTVLKTDNRPAPIRAADLGKIEIATWGADYVHVAHLAGAGDSISLPGALGSRVRGEPDKNGPAHSLARRDGRHLCA
jgi:hypothetical protein